MLNPSPSSQRLPTTHPATSLQPSLIRSPNPDPGGSSLSTIQVGDQLAARRTRSVAGQLSAVDRFLPAWILLAMAVGLGLGRVWPGLGPAIGRLTGPRLLVHPL